MSSRILKSPTSRRQRVPESENGLLALMRHHGIPITRQSYLELAYMGEPPDELRRKKK
jgi:hypothetical protein